MSVIKHFFTFVFQDITKLSELRRDHLIFYQTLLKEKGFANKTIHRNMSAVSSLCRHLAYEGIIAKDLSYGLKLPKNRNEKETADFSDDEVKKLFKQTGRDLSRLQR